MMKQYYDYYVNNVQYMYDNAKNMYESIEYAHAYAMDCYKYYGDKVKSSNFKAYLKAYEKLVAYSKKNMPSFDSFMKDGNFAAMYPAFQEMSKYYHDYYDASMQLYDQYSTVYNDKMNNFNDKANNYNDHGMMDRYMKYMKLFKDSFKANYANYYTRYGNKDNGTGYYMSLLHINDLKPYPGKEYYDSNDDRMKMEKGYKQHGLAVPIMAVAKKGANGKMNYHILDGYYMYNAMKKMGETYVPAIVYYGLPAAAEEAYMKSPYLGYNYKNA